MRKIILTPLCSLLVFVAQAQNVLKVQSGVVLSTTGGVTITLNDMDFDNDGILNQQGVVLFKGTAANHILGNTSSLFDVLQLAKTGGGKLTLQQGIRISSNITFGTGNLDLNGKNILLSPVALLNGESESSHITGENGGYIEIINTLNAPLGATPGNLGIKISSGQGLGSVTIRRGHHSQKNASGNGNTIFRYFDIEAEKNSGLNAMLRINYLDAELNGIKEDELTQWTSSDNLNWTNLGFTTRDDVNNFVEMTGIDHFSRFTLTSANNALPLQWGSFNTQCILGQTKINWKTAWEQNTSVFVVRRSTDGSTWSNIGNIPAAGNSSTTLSYSFTDPQPMNGFTYYQVFQQDLDGRKTFSPVLTSQCSASEVVKVYPVPAQNNCWVSIQSERNSSVSLGLYTMQGALLKQQNVDLMTGNNVYEIPLAKYPQGMYSLVIKWSDGKAKVLKVEKR
jgi:hypothetical protein